MGVRSITPKKNLNCNMHFDAFLHQPLVHYAKLLGYMYSQHAIYSNDNNYYTLWWYKIFRPRLTTYCRGRDASPHRRRSSGAWGAKPHKFSPHVWMCIESKLLKSIKKIVESTHKVIILIFVQSNESCSSCSRFLSLKWHWHSWQEELWQPRR